MRSTRWTRRRSAPSRSSPTRCWARCSHRARTTPACGSSCSRRCSRATPTTCSTRIGTRLIPSFDRIHEAMQRHRLERGEAERFIEGLLGLKLDRDTYERGDAFCAGVIERAGVDGLNRLWETERMLPTPAEIDAPGLWLARIDLPEDP